MRCGFPGDDSLPWTSRHASLVITEWNDACLDGMNERGLAAHALMFTTAEYEPPDHRPALATTRWIQYILDSFATVADALRGLSDVRIVPVDVQGVIPGLHIAIEGVTGDSAIIEPIGGQMVVHHGPQYQVMANSPSLDEQLANLGRYRPFGGKLPPPGDITSMDRFVRASYFLHYLPEPIDNRQAVAEVMQIASTVAKPPGVPYPDGAVYPTRWFSVADLTNLDYYFWSRVSPNLIWASMSSFEGEDRPRLVDAFGAALAGDVAAAMVPTSLPY